MLRTTNGGRSWVGIPAPKYKVARSGMSAGLLRLRFADAVDGYAYGSQLWVTHNGGSSWHRVRQVPGYNTDLEASAGAVYAASTGAGNTTKLLFASSDGGAHFTKAGSPPQGGDGGLLAEPTPGHVFVGVRRDLHLRQHGQWPPLAYRQEAR